MDVLTLIERFTEGQLLVLSAASALLHEKPEEPDEKGTLKRKIKRPPKPWKDMKAGRPEDYLAYLEEAGI